MSLRKTKEVKTLEDDLAFLCGLSEELLETQNRYSLHEAMARAYGLRIKGAIERIQGALGRDPVYAQRSLVRDVVFAIENMAPSDRAVLAHALQDLDRKGAKDGNAQAD